jgi:hypothetical protein
MEVLIKPFTNGVRDATGWRYGLGEAMLGIGEPGYSPFLKASPDDDSTGDKGANPATGLITLSG